MEVAMSILLRSVHALSTHQKGGLGAGVVLSIAVMALSPAGCGYPSTADLTPRNEALTGSFSGETDYYWGNGVTNAFSGDFNGDHQWDISVTGTADQSVRNWYIRYNDNSSCPTGGSGGSTCVQCNTNTDCSGVSGQPVCNTSTNTCVQCTATNSSACTDMTATCDVATNTCVGCLSNASCTTAAASRCSATACVGCVTNSDCTQIAGAPYCQAGMGCVQCQNSNDCGTAGMPICDAANYSCRICVSDNDCIARNAATPHCSSGSCVE
jgi:hypothetical protein